MKFKNTKNALLFLTFFSTVGLWGCSKDSSAEDEKEKTTYTLSSDTSVITFESGGDSQEITVTTNVDAWEIGKGGANWIDLSRTSGTSGTTKVTITADENTEIEERTTEITINANNVDAITITVTQTGASSNSGLYPDYNTNPLPADDSGMTSSAEEIAAKISLGWNIGNTLEAIGSETAWGNPMATKELIDFVKQSGFDAIRIPCSWDQYLEDADNAKIKTEWLDRVKEVVQYCVDNDMYVLLNIHWDGGWLENNVNEAAKEEVNAKQKAYWEQIATHLRDFDEHLLFASANEPAVDDAAQMAVLNTYHQTFVDAVRSTGGKNAYRTLVVQGPTTDIEKTNNLMHTLPTDTVVDRMMVEVHYYNPWQFAGLTEDANWGNMFYYWGDGYHSDTDTDRNATFGEEDFLDSAFQSMKTQFIDQGIPVVLGEFGATRRSSLTGDNLALHLASRAYYHKYLVQQAKANGLLPFYWDNGSLDNHGSGIFDRTDNTVFDQETLDALLEGVN